MQIEAKYEWHSVLWHMEGSSLLAFDSGIIDFLIKWEAKVGPVHIFLRSTNKDNYMVIVLEENSVKLFENKEGKRI